MHLSALNNARVFFETYGSKMGDGTVIDIGAQDVNGSLKSVTPGHLRYVGVDFIEARGVDVVLDDPYELPFETESIDIVVTSSCLEHSEMFWITFLEILRVLKPHGLLYMNVPSNGSYHRYPVDCWRFYPDSGRALVTWAQRNGYRPQLLESFVRAQHVDAWNDCVSVLVKDEAAAARYRDRIVDRITDFTNGTVAGSDEILRFKSETEDQTWSVQYRFRGAQMRMRGKLRRRRLARASRSPRTGRLSFPRAGR